MSKMACIFCDPETVIESDLSYARVDKFPVSPGHHLIIPKRHVETWFDMTDGEQRDVLQMIVSVKRFIEKKYSPDGYNIGMNCGESAGQTIPHAHIHVIPRYKGDMSNPSGGIRGVIPSKQMY
ncbi:HIT family protein [Halioglobus sp.]|nr:HIT family protein [Halioglobus sp.]